MFYTILYVILIEVNNRNQYDNNLPRLFGDKIKYSLIIYYTIFSTLILLVINNQLSNFKN